MNWNDRINRAEKRGHFTEEDRSLVINWGTCGVSEKLGINMVLNCLEEDVFVCSRLNGIGLTLGLRFCGAVGGDRFNDARDILNQIQNTNIVQ